MIEGRICGRNKRNINKLFKLEEDEYKSLRWQNVTLKSGHGEHTKINCNTLWIAINKVVKRSDEEIWENFYSNLSKTMPENCGFILKPQILVK